MENKNHDFKSASDAALANTNLQQALGKLKQGFIHKRSIAIKNIPEFEQLRDDAIAIKNHTLQHLDYYLEQFEDKVLAQKGQVHWAETASDACKMIINICKSANAKLITKSKSMITEEIGLNAALEAEDFKVIETDLGEYIIQIRKESPTHIVVPAIHVLKNEIAENFREHHSHLNPNRSLDETESLLIEARSQLRQHFLNAEVGITGANCLIAENGAIMIVTNEGNADLTQTCAKIHIVVASIDKMVPTVEDAMSILRLLPRSASGQPITSYVTFAEGLKRMDEEDGPNQLHVILLDNGRSELLGGDFEAMLRCIRCGACLNHCPVYSAIGGQSYGATYPGPMGAVLSPSLFGIKPMKDLPNASTFCGRCEEVCPMKIPLPSMMRIYREKEFQSKLAPKTNRLGLGLWAFVARKPRLYHLIMSIVAFVLSKLGKQNGRLTFLLFASGWTKHRDFPVPVGKTFHALWQKRERLKQ